MAGIVVSGLSKRFGPVQALEGVDLTVKPGEVVALLGVNGAGKSTLVRILSTTVLPDQGSVQVGGFDVVKDSARARETTGVVLGEERSFYWRLTGRENLEFFAALHGLRRRAAVKRVQIVIETTGLDEVADRRVDRYSSGMRARLGLARSLLGLPSVLLLDEPTRSLDPLATIAVRTLVVDLAASRSVAVMFVTHDLHEAAAMASEVVILTKGRITAVVEGGTDTRNLERAFIEANA